MHYYKSLKLCKNRIQYKLEHVRVLQFYATDQFNIPLETQCNKYEIDLYYIWRLNKKTDFLDNMKVFGTWGHVNLLKMP